MEHCAPAMPLVPLIAKLEPAKLKPLIPGSGRAATLRIPFSGRLFVSHIRPGPGLDGLIAKNVPAYLLAAKSRNALPAASGVAERLVRVSVPPKVMR